MQKQNDKDRLEMLAMLASTTAMETYLMCRLSLHAVQTRISIRPIYVDLRLKIRKGYLDTVFLQIGVLSEFIHKRSLP